MQAGHSRKSRIGSANGSRTRDLLDENQVSWTTRRWRQSERGGIQECERSCMPPSKRPATSQSDMAPESPPMHYSGPTLRQPQIVLPEYTSSRQPVCPEAAHYLQGRPGTHRPNQTGGSPCRSLTRPPPLPGAFQALQSLCAGYSHSECSSV